MINLKLSGIDSEEKWHEDGKEFGLSPSIRWVDVSVEKEDPSITERLQGKHKVGEQVSVIVCSPAYKSEPRENEDLEQLEKALIQDEFNEDAVREYVNRKLREVEGETWKDVFASLNSHFTVID
jgi:hypothetical protein